MSDSKVHKCCGNCTYSEPSFNLLWCSLKNSNVLAEELCKSWTQKTNGLICLACKRIWLDCDCKDEDWWLG